MRDEEELLDGGNSNPDVVRVGDTVRRATGPWTPSVHRLLAHLDEPYGEVKLNMTRRLPLTEPAPAQASAV